MIYPPYYDRRLIDFLFAEPSVISDDVMEHIDGAVKVCEITELLRAEYGVVTGKDFFFCTSQSTHVVNNFLLNPSLYPHCAS